MAGNFSILESEVFHAVVEIAPRNCEWAVLDLDSLGAIVFEELWLKLSNREILDGIFTYHERHSQ